MWLIVIFLFKTMRWTCDSVESLAGVLNNNINTTIQEQAKLSLNLQEHTVS